MAGLPAKGACRSEATLTAPDAGECSRDVQLRSALKFAYGLMQYADLSTRTVCGILATLNEYPTSSSEIEPKPTLATRERALVYL